MRIKPPFSEVFIVSIQANLYKILCTEKAGSTTSLGNVFTLIQVIFNLLNIFQSFDKSVEYLTVCKHNSE